MAVLALMAALLVAALLSPAAAWPCVEGCTCEYSNALFCADAGLDHPPEGYWPGIGMLRLTNNKVPSLSPHSLTGYPAMTSIDLSANGLSVLDLEAFVATPRVYEINVNNNPIDTVLSPKPKNQLKNVMYLHLDGTAITHLDPYQLQNAMPALLYLFIADTPMDAACNYEDLYWWAKSRGIYLFGSTCSFDEKESCPSECSCDDAQMICNSAGLNHLPEGLWSDYTFLVLSANSITSLHEYSFTGFPNLTWLDFAASALEELQWEAFAALTQLEYLNLYGKKIDAIEAPAEGVQLPKLQTLSLAGTNIAELDTDILENAFPLLRSIYIDNTPMACGCDYKDLAAWAQGKGISLSATCISTVCSF